MKSSSESNQPNEMVEKIIDGVYRVKIPLNHGHTDIGYVNTYLVAGTSGWLLIDTGWSQPDSFISFHKSLDSINIDITSLQQIVLTHSHPDHYGMAGKLRQHAYKIQMMCHRWEADLIESRYIKFFNSREDTGVLLRNHGVPETELEFLGAASMPVLKLVTITLPDRLLYGGEIISTGIFDLEVIWTPGHSPGHICLYEPKNKLLFCGDHVLPNITPNVGYHVLSGDNPLGDYEYALGKLSKLPVALALPGHENCFNNLQDRIKEILKHHDKRKKEILAVLDNNTYNSYEVASRLRWNVGGMLWAEFPAFQKRAAIFETIAHLEKLRWDGAINKIIDNHRVTYKII